MSALLLSAGTFSMVLLQLILAGTGDRGAGEHRSVGPGLVASVDSHLRLRSSTEPFCRGKSASSSVPCQRNRYLGSEAGGTVPAKAAAGRLQSPRGLWDRPGCRPAAGTEATSRWKVRSGKSQ